MSTLFQRAWNLLRRPDRIPERLIERRMRQFTKTYTQNRTDADNDLERLATFATLGSIENFVEEAKAVETYQYVEQIKKQSTLDIATALSQTSSLTDFITMYVLIRLFQPKTMIETGVFFGGFSSMILHAMEKNGFGQLYSIDLPIESDGLAPELRGNLVPEPLRRRWDLILGDSQIELPRLLNRLGKIDAFNHDSMHTTRFMTWEYETVWPYIRKGGFLSSHDIFMSASWSRFLHQHRKEIDFSGSVYVFGIARKRS